MKASGTVLGGNIDNPDGPQNLRRGNCGENARSSPPHERIADESLPSRTGDGGWQGFFVSLDRLPKRGEAIERPLPLVAKVMCFRRKREAGLGMSYNHVLILNVY
jgi:hypothetical protein